VDRGAADLWVLSSWLPRGTAVAATADALAADTVGAEGPLYVQVSTSKNAEWSGRLAQDLARAGLAARVLPPQGPEDGYRVVLGPYATRAQAEATGRKLGRPFWIYQPGQ
jgi:cell division protein FtsN